MPPLYPVLLASPSPSPVSLSPYPLVTHSHSATSSPTHSTVLSTPPSHAPTPLVLVVSAPSAFLSLFPCSPTHTSLSVAISTHPPTLPLGFSTHSPAMCVFFAAHSISLPSSPTPLSSISTSYLHPSIYSTPSPLPPYFVPPSPYPHSLSPNFLSTLHIPHPAPSTVAATSSLSIPTHCLHPCSVASAELVFSTQSPLLYFVVSHSPTSPPTSLYLFAPISLSPPIAQSPIVVSHTSTLLLFCAAPTSLPPTPMFPPTHSLLAALLVVRPLPFVCRTILDVVHGSHSPIGFVCYVKFHCHLEVVVPLPPSVSSADATLSIASPSTLSSLQHLRIVPRLFASLSPVSQCTCSTLLAASPTSPTSNFDVDSLPSSFRILVGCLPSVLVYLHPILPTSNFASSTPLATVSTLPLPTPSSSTAPPGFPRSISLGPIPAVVVCSQSTIAPPASPIFLSHFPSAVADPTALSPHPQSVFLAVSTASLFPTYIAATPLRIALATLRTLLATSIPCYFCAPSSQSLRLCVVGSPSSYSTPPPSHALSTNPTRHPRAWFAIGSSGARSH
uniref:DNA-directed RNA polymerase II subunit RPB1 n=1 Tax=Lygus hesperus TaxID=30085 RepID=A0A0A9Z7J6_LYGHE